MPSRRRHHLEPLDDVLEAQRGDERAPPCLQLHQSGRGKLHQRLPDRGARNLEPSGQALLVQPVAGAELARNNVLLEGVA